MLNSRNWLYVDYTDCEIGYKQIDGDILGSGSIAGRGSREDVASCAECATICSKIDTCLSYECSLTELKCNLNTAAVPNTNNQQDWIFCVKNINVNIIDNLEPSPTLGVFKELNIFLSV